MLLTNLIEKSIHTLELPKILEMLKMHAVTDEGKQRAVALRPFSELERVARHQEETSAAVEYIILQGTPSFSGVRFIADSLQRADMGGVLNPKELLSIGAVLRSARQAKEYGQGEAKHTVIDQWFRSLTVNRLLEEAISNAIVGEDEIADSASPELASIRRHIRATSGKVRDLLNKLLASSQAKFLQETIITMRSGRFVVPVKSEHKNEIPGLVHDVSGSGSTFFVEPMSVVKANNELRELYANEEHEIERILSELSAQVAENRSEIEKNYELLVILDVIFAKGKLSISMKGKEPSLTENEMYLKKAKHPLIDPKDAVANDLYLGGEFETLVVTGPNTGGKTVTLKTIGLLTLMTQCGLHIPVEDGSLVAVRSQVLADIGDEQSIAQSLSTFSSHMTNIVAILEHIDDRALVLFDELGAGTDPVEGAALAVSIIEKVRSVGALILATTHYAELKVYAMSTVGVKNASCEFDVETLAPTYRLLIGVPGKSNAFAIAKRLGLSEEMIQSASERMDKENVDFEDVISQLNVERQNMEHETHTARLLRVQLENEKNRATRFREEMQIEREKVTEKARREAQEIIEEARRVSDETFKELKEMRKQAKRNATQNDNERRASLRKKLNDADDAFASKFEVEDRPMMRLAVDGDVVELLKFGKQATVLSVNKDGTLQLQAGIMRVSAKQEEVRVVEKQVVKKEVQVRKQAQRQLRNVPTSSELDLRGMTTDEAEMTLNRFIDQAMMGNLNSVTVIHGKGTGAVRKAVHLTLKRHKHVKSFRLGRFGEGEDGVTVVEMK